MKLRIVPHFQAVWLCLGVNRVLLNDRDYQSKGDKIDPNRPFNSRVIDFSDFCDIIGKQLEEIWSLGGAGEMERYNVVFDELTKLFERKPEWKN